MALGMYGNRHAPVGRLWDHHRNSNLVVSLAFGGDVHRDRLTRVYVDRVGGDEVARGREKSRRKSKDRPVGNVGQGIALHGFESEHLVFAAAQLGEAELAVGTSAHLPDLLPSAESIANFATT